MNEYLFFTTEGTTISPNGTDVENCQILGRSRGDDAKTALDALLRANGWINDAGFTKDRVRNVCIAS